jgi:hypothetical protein
VPELWRHEGTPPDLTHLLRPEGWRLVQQKSGAEDKAPAKSDDKPAKDSKPAETKGDGKPTPPKKGGGKGKKAAA